VTEHEDQLREAFQSHESQAPDAGLVYQRVVGLAHTYKRRRRTAQVAGGAFLGVSLIAGAVAVPSMLPGRPDPAAVIVAPAAAPATPSLPSAVPPSSVPTGAELQKAWDAYFFAGYDYQDAVQLAKLWKSTEDIGTVKAQAGRKLLDGETLPVTPDPDNVKDAEEGARIDAFEEAGYVFADAEKLAELWKLGSPYDAKSAAGQKLLDGETLPIQPKPSNVEDVRDSQRVSAFFAVGYDYDDAVKLAKRWKLADAYRAKIEGGKRLIAGETLPIKP